MDVVIVGGGVLGTMHAWEAVERGHRVVQLERDAEARSASVRNFGLVWVSGRRDGVELALAQRAREQWESIGARVTGVGFRANGSLTVALDDTEFEVMAKFAATDAAADRGIALVDAVTASAINPAVRGDIRGGLHCPRDAAVESRVALPAMRAAIAATGRYALVAPRHAVALDGTTVVDHLGGRHAADAVVICPGSIHDDLAGEHLAHAPLRRCQLQMMQTAPLAEPLTTSIADADSLRYYPAYAGVDLGPLGEQPGVAAAARMQLLMVQRLDGGLTIGDTHAYDDEAGSGPFPFDVDEAPYDHLVGRAEAILGRRLPPARRRWVGVYSELDPARNGSGAVYYRAAIDDGVVVVTGPGGRGMTLSPAIAEQTAEEMNW